MFSRTLVAALSLTVLAYAVNAHADRAPTLAPFIAVDAPVTALTHVTVIDGTGAAARADQTIVIAAGKITSVGPAGQAKIPKDAKVLALAGATVMPGLVGMHDHLFMMGTSRPRMAPTSSARARTPGRSPPASRQTSS